jgi:GNAT superfamily N-acetyltransferase
MRGATGTSRAVIGRERAHGRTAGAASKLRRDKQERHIVERSPTAGSGCAASYGIRRGSNGDASGDDPMTRDVAGGPAELQVSFDAAPSLETRAALGHEINAYQARTVPEDGGALWPATARWGNRLVAGLSGVLAWQWLFVEALRVSDAWHGRGIGRALLAQAKAHAVAAGRRSAWLDTSQARGFYLALGYQQFGILDHYPRPDPQLPVQAAGRGDGAAVPLDHLLMVRFAWCSGLTSRERPASIRWNQIPGTLLMPAHQP